LRKGAGADEESRSEWILTAVKFQLVAEACAAEV